LARWEAGARLTVLVAVLSPIAVALVLVPFRDDFSNTNAALVLVLVIVSIAAFGSRVAGLLAALSAAASFDFFLTEPYQAFAINDRDDVETTVLLLAVGVGVSEIAAWGRRQDARADREAGYLAGVREAAEAVASRQSSDEVLRVVSDQLSHVLGLRACRFQYGAAGLGQPARLRPDGQVEWKHNVVDVHRDGLPVTTDIELLVENHGRLQGRFLLTAAPDSRPTLAQLQVAVTLAGVVGTVLS